MGFWIDNWPDNNTGTYGNRQGYIRIVDKAEKLWKNGLEFAQYCLHLIRSAEARTRLPLLVAACDGDPVVIEARARSVTVPRGTIGWVRRGGKRPLR